MGKRIISVILVILLCLNMLPFNVAAAEEKALASQREAVSAEEDPTEKERVPASPSEAVPERKEEKDPPVKEKIPASPSEAVPAKEEEELPAEPYYLFLVHFLDIDGGQYASSELVELEPDDLLDSAYDLRQNILEKEGMKAVAASLFCGETGELEESWTVSLNDFTQGGDPEDGSAYYAVQAMIEYSVAGGYKAVISEDAGAFEDPYGVMPLENFRGGNIKDISFVSADVLTLRIQYKYSPTGGLAGMDAADSQVFQIKVDNVVRDETGKVASAGPFSETWDLPCYGGIQNVPALEGFRIVLNPEPLNAFLNDPELAKRAMDGELSQFQIQEALENDSFSVNVDDPHMPVYQSQVDADSPVNSTYQNRYSDIYNEAWDNARIIQGDSYMASAVQGAAVGFQGANPLHDPQLILTMTPKQCAAALNSDDEITVTVYYRRNAGFYHVGHWVPNVGLSDADISAYTQMYPDYNRSGVGPFDQDYLMVYLERKQGRVGALTNAKANPKEAERVLSSFLPHPVNQKIIAADTRVDIRYDTADRYGLIFQTEESYIPRQYVNKGYTVTFTDGSGGRAGMEVKDSNGESVSGYVDYKNPTRQGYTFAGWKYQVRDDVTGDDVVEENGNFYKKVGVNHQWEIDTKMLAEAIVIRDSDNGDAKMIYLYPVWTPDMANVRVVYWTEDLSGGANDVKVTVTKDESGGKALYLNNLDKAYINGTPAAVPDNAHFSNVGSFTFTASTNSALDLSMQDGAFSTTMTDTFFTTTGESEGMTGTDNKTGTLKQLIDAMFPFRMPNASTSTGSINTSRFYHPYGVQEPRKTEAGYTVAPDGSTVINVYYARNVYTLDFTYYGEIDGQDGRVTGVQHDGEGGLVVSTNTTAYSKRALEDIGEDFDYNYQNPKDKDENRWQRVDITTAPRWTVPKTLTISAKYDADLREVWPLSRGESIHLTLENGDDRSKGWTEEAIFMSWGATVGPFNQTYRTGASNESTTSATTAP